MRSTLAWPSSIKRARAKRKFRDDGVGKPFRATAQSTDAKEAVPAVKARNCVHIPHSSNAEYGLEAGSKFQSNPDAEPFADICPYCAAGPLHSRGSSAAPARFRRDSSFFLPFR